MTHIIVDLEFTPVPFGCNSKLSQEIIEIGAVRLDNDYHPTDTFSLLVRPEHRYINPVCASLTGIHFSDLETALSFQDAYTVFENWVGSEPYILYQWSENDFFQLRKECKFHGIKSNLCNKDWVDIQRKFSELVGISSVFSLEKALRTLDISFSGTMHRAKDDAWNTALILHTMTDRQEFERRFSKIRMFTGAHSQCSTLGELFGEQFQKLYDELETA